MNTICTSVFIQWGGEKWKVVVSPSLLYEAAGTRGRDQQSANDPAQLWSRIVLLVSHSSLQKYSQPFSCCDHKPHINRILCARLTQYSASWWSRRKYCFSAFLRKIASWKVWCIYIQDPVSHFFLQDQLSVHLQLPVLTNFGLIFLSIIPHETAPNWSCWIETFCGYNFF